MDKKETSNITVGYYHLDEKQITIPPRRIQRIVNYKRKI